MAMYQLTKALWDDSDVAVMGWHDSTVWPMLVNPGDYEFLIDLDYIFEWVEPRTGEVSFKFWVAPVTMVFDNVESLRIDIESSNGAIEIADLYRENPELTSHGEFTRHTYRFSCQDGEFSLKSTGFHMFVRQTPILCEGQSRNLLERGGVSFERTTCAA